MTTQIKPVIRPLTKDEAETFLAQHSIGRIALCLRERADLEPIHYVYDPPWVFGRTSLSTKLVTLAHSRWCAFETDEVRGLFDWETVVVKGPFYALNASLYKSENFERALAALRHLIPETLTDDDPTPERDVVFGVHVSRIEGRLAVTNEPR